MAKIDGVVYDPPSEDLPYLVVLLYQGQVLSARACVSVAVGEAFLAEIMPELQAKIDKDKGK